MTSEASVHRAWARTLVVSGNTNADSRKRTRCTVRNASRAGERLGSCVTASPATTPPTLSSPPPSARTARPRPPPPRLFSRSRGLPAREPATRRERPGAALLKVAPPSLSTKLHRRVSLLCCARTARPHPPPPRTSPGSPRASAPVPPQIVFLLARPAGPRARSAPGAARRFAPKGHIPAAQLWSLKRVPAARPQRGNTLRCFSPAPKVWLDVQRWRRVGFRPRSGHSARGGTGEASLPESCRMHPR
jgi:hypothetical protein